MKAKLIKTIIIIVIALSAFVLSRLIMLGRESSTMTVNLGQTANHTLFPCESSSNCYSGQIGSQENPIPKLIHVVQQMGMEIVTRGDLYFHSTSKSTIFGFVDDVEFLYNPQEKILTFRSASRVGKSDLGANQNRINEILDKSKML